MRDLPRDADLLAKAGQVAGVSRDALGQELQRDRMIQLEVIGAVNLAHAAAPQQTNDPIARSQARAWIEAAVQRRRGIQIRSRGLRVVRHAFPRKSRRSEEGIMADEA